MDANLRRQPPVAAPYCTAPPRQPERGVYEGGLRFTALEFTPAKIRRQAAVYNPR
jgi:hypothetical protein